MSWVSNPVPVNKNQATIRVCTDFQDLNHACPKDNFPTPFIDQIIDYCADPKAFSFMDSFSGYNMLALCNFPKAIEAVTEATSKPLRVFDLSL
jgi:hypothetical protein